MAVTSDRRKGGIRACVGVASARCRSGRTRRSGVALSATPDNGTSRYRLEQVEKRFDRFESQVDTRFKELDAKLDRLTIAIVGGSITVAVSVIVFTVTYLASGPP
jgi:hypothetical protein